MKLRYFLVMLLVLFVPIVYAEDDNCDAGTKVSLNKAAASVKANYEFVYSEDGEVTSFNIIVYNVSGDLLVNITSEQDGTNVSVVPSMTENGTYKHNVGDINNIITYKVVVRSTIPNCTYDIRSFTIIKPRRNPYYDRMICKYEEVADYVYCKEWVTMDFKDEDEKIIEKIKKEYDKKTIPTTTICESCELEERIENSNIFVNQTKLAIAIGLIIGIILDVLTMVLLIKRIKENSF